MHNELNRSIATEQYNDHVRLAAQRTLANQATNSQVRIMQVAARIVANLLIASGEGLLRYSETETPHVGFKEIAHNA
jgi:hypothetical protein